MNEHSAQTQRSALRAAPPLSDVRDLEGVVTAVEHHPLPLFTLKLRLEQASYPVHPGQFVMAQAPSPLEPYLRRAFSVLTVEETGAGAEVAIHGRVVGRGTEALAACRPGQTLRLLGPLGNGFDLDASAAHHVLVAGGVGSAAIVLLVEALAARGERVTVIYGGRSAADLVHADLFREILGPTGGDVRCTTEDGSDGEEGRVTGPLEEILSRSDGASIYTCGPEAMMAAVVDLAKRFDCRVQTALETPMGCGYGACLGCVVPKIDGSMELCCRSGPVFDGREVAW